MPILVVVKPDLFNNSYLLIIFSRFLRLHLGATILTANEKLSSNEVTSQLYKMVINLTMLIVISAFLFTGIENQQLIVEIKDMCHHNRPIDCLDETFATLNPESCIQPMGTCDKLYHA